MKYVHGIFKGDKDEKYKEDNGKIVILIITAFLERDSVEETDAQFNYEMFNKFA
jgi:hypothetical protein